MGFTIIAPKTLIFEPHAIERVSESEYILDKKTFIIAGSRTLERNGVIRAFVETVKKTAREARVYLPPKGEPDIRMVDDAAEAAREYRPDVVIALGGGSTIDLAKAVAMLSVNEGSALDYLEGAEHPRAITAPPLPFIAIPTTSGSGAEATKNAVIASSAHRTKRSMRSPSLMAREIYLDPFLTIALSPRQTAIGGFDALGQLIESYISKKATVYTQQLALLGIELLGARFLACYENGDDLAARSDLQFAAYLSGHCLANSGLGAAHGIAAALGGRYPDIPHGLIVASLLPETMRFNLEAVPEKLGAIGAILTGKKYINAFEAAIKGIEYVETLREKMKIHSAFAAYEVSEKDVDCIANASFGNSMSGNPRDATETDIAALLRSALTAT